MTAVYLAVTSPALPTLWFAVAPEGTARALPNVVMKHDGETPEYDSSGDVVMEKAGATFMVYGSCADVRAVAERIKAAYTAAVLFEEIDDKKTRLYRGKYVVRESMQRGPTGEFLFEAE